MINLIRRLFPSLPSSINIAKSYFYDAIRFMKFNTNNRHRQSKRKHQAILVRATHGLEKAFSLPEMKSIFGVNQAGFLIGELRAYMERFGVDDSVREAFSVLDSYFSYHSLVDDPQVVNLVQTYAEMKIIEYSSDLNDGCYCECERGDTYIKKDNFSAFFMSRYSVRKFDGLSVSKDLFVEAASVAGKTPSACNRQPWKVRVFTNKDRIREVLKIQNGNRGFSDSICNLAVVSGYLSYFSSKERNQVFIDCGMYSMSLILSLHSMGISTCPLNLSYQAKEERVVSKVLGFDEDEVPIMMIAFGEAASDAKCAKSMRRSVSEFVEFID